MKKIILLVLIFVSFIFAGCVSDPPVYLFDSDELITNTVKIELVECVNDNPEIIKVDDDTITSFDYNSANVLDKLDNIEFENFIIRLSTIRFHIDNRSVNKPIGKTLILHQKSGNMIVLSCTSIESVGYSFVSEFDSNNNYIAHIARFAERPLFELLINEYFDY